MSREDVTSLWRKAEEYAKKGDYGSELKVYQRLEKMGVSFEVLYGKGLLYEKIGNFKQASQVYKQGEKEAQKRGIEEWRIKFWQRRIAVLISILLEIRKYSRASKILQGAIKTDSQNSELHELLAKVYLDLEDLDLGLEELDRVIELEEDTELKAATFFNKGVVLGKKGDIEGAKQAYLKGIEINPQYGDSYINLGNIYLVEGNEEKGFQMFLKAEEIGCQRVSLFFNLATLYIRRQDWEKGRRYIREVIEREPKEIKDLLKITAPSAQTLLTIDEILEMKNQKIEEEFFRVLKEEKYDRENISISLVFRGLEEIDRIDKRSKKGKKIKARDQRVLNLVERGLKIIDQAEIEERKAKERLINEKRKLIKVLKVLIEKQKQEEKVYEEFFLKYQDFIDEEEFSLYLEEAQERGKLILREIERAVDIFVQEFEKRNLELVIDGVSLDEKATIPSGLRIIEKGGGNYALRFVFNIVSKRFLAQVDLEELASHYVSQAEMWDKLPDYLADGLIAQVPKSFDFRQWFAGQKIRNIKAEYHQTIIESVNREGFNLIVDILKSYFRPEDIKEELVYLKKELDFWTGVLSQEKALLEELPIGVRRIVFFARTPELIGDKELEEKFREVKNLIESDKGCLNEIHRYYQDLAKQVKIRSR